MRASRAILMTLLAVGVVVDATAAPHVRLRKAKKLLASVSVRMGANAEGFNNARLDYRLYFESADCSGPPLMSPSQDRFFPPTAIVFGDTAYYVTDGTPRSISSLAVFGSGQADCDSAYEGSVFVAPNRCCRGGLPANTYVVGTPTTFDLTTLALVTPFRLDIPVDAPERTRP